MSEGHGWRRVWVLALVLLLAAPATAGATLPGTEGPIALGRNGGRGVGSQIWVANPDGSHLGMLIQGTGLTSHWWLPDGRLAYLNHNDLFYADLRAGTTRVAARDYPYNFVRYAPDGRRIAALDEHGNLVVADADGGNERTLAQVVNPPYDYISAPEWSPDGSEIGYLHPGADGPPALRAVRPDGSGDRVIGSSPTGIDAWSWEPSGNRVAVVVKERGPSREQPVQWSLELWGRDGSGRTSVLSSLAGMYADWSPAGGHLVLQRDGRMWTVAPDGSDQRAITPTDQTGFTNGFWGSGPLLTKPVKTLRELKVAKAVRVRRVRGTVQVQPRTTGGYTRLRGARRLPAGARIDVRRGRAEIDGGFVLRDGHVRVVRGLDGRMAFELTGGLRGCGGASSARPGRSVRAEGKGLFTINGKRSYVRGERAGVVVQDLCDGSTATRVVRGSVILRDWVEGKRVVLHKGDVHVVPATSSLTAD
jgi:hypothetical protein